MRALTYSLVVVIFIATVGLGWLFDKLYDQYTDSREFKDKDVVELMVDLGSQLAISLNNLEDKQLFIDHWKNDKGYVLEIISLQSSALAGGFIDEIKGGRPLILESNSQLTVYYYLEESGELLVFKVPQTFINNKPNSINYLFTFLFYLTLLLMFLLWIYPLLKQLLSLRDSVKLIGKGKLEHRIKSSSVSYIQEIEIEVNRMAQRIENLISDVKLLSSAVSHNLRTPLARIRFGLDTLMEENDPVLSKRYQDKISENVEEMTTLVETLLSFARLDQSMLELSKTPVVLDRVIRQCVKLNELPRVKFELVWVESDYVVNADKNYISMLFNNIVENAVKYGKSYARITLISEPDEVIVVVEDDGPGIPQESRKKVLEPFCRGKFVGNIKGTGIGLAIVKRVVEWHRGSIEISQSEILGGAKISIFLPR